MKSLLILTALFAFAVTAFAQTYVFAKDEKTLLAQSPVEGDYGYVDNTFYKNIEGKWVKQKYSKEVRGERKGVDENSEPIVVKDGIIKPSVPNFRSPRPAFDMGFFGIGKVRNKGSVIKWIDGEETKVYVHGPYEGEKYVFLDLPKAKVGLENKSTNKLLRQILNRLEKLENK